ncbi:MAG TPA: hypothetical protein VEY71_02145 [Chitinophagales bacterium]|nr:hypothetical protein [Chitinophagales bacterium]
MIRLACFAFLTVMGCNASGPGTPEAQNNTATAVDSPVNLVATDTVSTNPTGSNESPDSTIEEKQVVAPDDRPTPRFTPQYTPGPHVLVYKTRGRYDNLVPVLLSDDKKSIVSYPHPADLKETSKPTLLHDGYLLDNRGIGSNVAFLKWSYDDYRKRTGPPSLDTMYGAIIDKAPLVAMYDCGNRKAFTDPQRQLNEIIDAGELAGTFKAIVAEPN